MKKAAFLASTIFLAACSPGYGGVDSASAQSAAATAPDVDPDAALNTFFEDYDREELANSPLSKSFRGIRDADYGKLDDPSEAAAIADYERGQAALTEMERRFDKDSLSPAGQLSYRLFQARAERSRAAFPFRRNGYIFDQMRGAQSQIPAFMINIHQVTNKEDAEAYVSRLSAVGPFIETLVAQAAERANDGIMVPDWVFPYVISDARNVISGGPFEEGEPSPLFADLQKKVNALDLPAAEKRDLIARGEEALLGSLAPAYRKLIAEMERQQATAGDGDGVWRFKDGAAYYAERLKNYTTTDLTADQIHQIGLDNVARIHGEMRKIMQQVGFEGSLQEFFVHLRTGDQYFHTSREDYLAEANAKLAEMEKKLPEFFNTLPKAPFVIKPVEAFREKSAGKAFYQRPAPDGSRPGTYYVNLYDLKSMSKTELEALAYHEALPGHHLQLAIQTELGELPAFRKFGGITAYSEGWGLYTEELGKDMGFYTDPYSDFGRLGMELWRACRLVVDTGIHDKRWSREKAIAYLTENTPNPDGDIRKAIERYIVFPGQATAYMIGKLKILELRERAQTRLGDKFTMGDFHDVILRSGPVPLNIMEERIDSWIAGAR
ncbi:Uncharacterized conserved protein, DUF885 familyt [Parasphingorhabdus marina DSM 22363]|uniref:Uncharacterized conserved protein, DUF885 familyt n=1 Tax=Parasphingorhabdus marina DSM 22363 TaxID=1123272 RepID=A0A1N6CNQ1_9SPHN|nr:DUF885 domain-containing protein [Parasphingorhabdus marina]SIN59994.1 Uncharacterized conserved protein, DUF885 familyt [Parasphingorhabdus marina DSM 22363]